MQYNNFNFTNLLQITSNVLERSVIEDFINKIVKNKNMLLIKLKTLYSSNLSYEELNKDIKIYEKLNEDVKNKIAEMKRFLEKNPNLKDETSQEKMHSLMKETTKILDDFEKEINAAKSSQVQTNNNLMQIDYLKDESVNSNYEESDEESDENSSDYVNVDELKSINKPSNNDKNLQNNNLMQIDDEIIQHKPNNIVLNNKIELYINCLRIKKVKHLLEICNRYLEKYKDEKYLKKLLENYITKIKSNKDENITIPCLINDSKYIIQYKYILNLMKKSSKLQNKTQIKYEQQKLRIIEYFYYILCAMGFVNQHGILTNKDAFKDFENLIDFLERKIKNMNKQ